MKDYRLSASRLQRQSVTLCKLLIISLSIAALILIVAKFPRRQPKVFFQQNKQLHKVTAVFLTCCGRHDMLQQTLQSFFQYNQTPLQKIIVVNDGLINAELAKIMRLFPNVTVLSTGKGQGQIRAVDMVFRLVKTPYVYYSEDDHKMIRSGMINMSIQHLQQEPKLLQMYGTPHRAEPYLLEGGLVGVDFYFQGFSFNQVVLRMSDYNQIQGGFTKVTRDISKGTGSGTAEDCIVYYFRRRGYYVRQTKEYYFVHLGAEKGLPRKQAT